MTYIVLVEMLNPALLTCKKCIQHLPKTNTISLLVVGLRIHPKASSGPSDPGNRTPDGSYSGTGMVTTRQVFDIPCHNGHFSLSAAQWIGQSVNDWNE